MYLNVCTDANSVFTEEVRVDRLHFLAVDCEEAKSLFVERSHNVSVTPSGVATRGLYFWWP